MEITNSHWCFMMGLIPFEIETMKEVVKEKICLFGSDGRVKKDKH